MTVFLYILGILILVPLFFWFESWLLMVVWNVFMVDVFHLASLDLGHAFYGVLLLTIVGGAFRSISSSK